MQPIYFRTLLRLHVFWISHYTTTEADQWLVYQTQDRIRVLSRVCYTALNKNNGDIAWEKDRNEQTSWTTPLVLNVEGKTQIIVNGTKRTRSYDPAEGDVIWECGGQTQNVIPTPVAGFGMVFCTSGFRGNKLQAIKLGKTGDLTGTDSVVWQVDKATPYVPSPLQKHVFP